MDWMDIAKVVTIDFYQNTFKATIAFMMPYVCRTCDVDLGRNLYVYNNQKSYDSLIYCYDET